MNNNDFNGICRLSDEQIRKCREQVARREPIIPGGYQGVDFSEYDRVPQARLSREVLTDRQVRFIRTSNATNDELGRAFGVDGAHISRVRGSNGKEY